MSVNFFLRKHAVSPTKREKPAHPFYQYPLFYLLVSGFYLSLNSSWSGFHKATICAHPFIGAVCAVFLLPKMFRSASFSAALLCAFLSGACIIFSKHILPAYFFHAHALSGFVLCAVFVFLQRPETRTACRGAHVAMAFTLLIYVFFFAAEKSPSVFTYEAVLSTVPYQKREEKMFPSYKKEGASFLSVSESCGKDARCHQNILSDFKHSAHNASYRTSYFQKNLQLLASEEGKKNTLICAGCHTPLALFSNRADFSYFKNHDNSSCVFCHSIRDVNIIDKRTSSYALSLHKNHLSMFTGDEQKGLKKVLNFYYIKLNPSAHKKVFSKPLYKQDEYCRACHHLNIAPPDNQGFVRATCVDCHMQKQNAHGLSGVKKNHYFPGTNTATPFVLGETKYLHLMRRWIRGDVGMDLKTGNLAWQLKTRNHAPPRKAFWLVMTLEALKKPRAGEKLPFRIFTSNVGMEHDFPAAPLDLIDVWLEVNVADERGRVIFHSGALDKNFHVDKNAHRLGGVMLDKEGRKITKNRVWAIDKKIVLRAIKPGETVYDDYAVSVPEWTKKLHVTAQWNYRKLNQDFILWAFSGKTMTMPVTPVGSLQVSVAVP